MRESCGHSDAHCCAETSRGRVHGEKSQINAGSRCCSTCGTEAKAAGKPRTDKSGEGRREEDSGESGEEEPSSAGCGGPTGSPRKSEQNTSNKETGCSCCSAAINLDGDEDRLPEEKDEFRREMKLLGSLGAILAFLLIFENQIEHTIGIYPLNAAFLAIYLICGVPILKTAWRAIRGLDIFNEFTLMSTATLAAIGIGEMSEAVGVMLFYRVGEAFQEKAASQSRRSIKALLAQKPMSARILSDGKEADASPRDVRSGDLVKVLPGEMIPVDGIVQSGAALVDNSAITGESIPLSAAAGTAVYGGTLSLDGMLLVKASGPFEDSTIAKILEMVQNAVERKSGAERFITRFAKWYTPAVFAVAACVAVIPPLAGYGRPADWLYRGLVLLVISCPCALVISIPLGFFGGVGAASKQGILVKGANVFDALAKITTVVFDKTGTLTRGVFEVAEVIAKNGGTREALLETAALAESGAAHPIAKAIIKAAPRITPPASARITQVAGKGVVCEAEGTVIAAGNPALMADYGVRADEAGESGTVVHVQRDGTYLGYITVSDRIRAESGTAVGLLRRLGVKSVYMLTGDRETEAERVARELGLDGFRAGLLPQEKVSALRGLSGDNTARTLFVGDGANDGPVLASAGVGVAMGGLGSQVAVEVADVVILDDSPAKAADLIKIGKKTRAIVWQNITIAMAVKGIFIVLGAAGLAGLWEAVFADVGVALLAILNATRAARS